MERFVDDAFDKGREMPSCVVAQHGSRIIGVSVLDADPDSLNHLSSGPVILHEYRNRGLGSALLAASLNFLRQEGLSKVRGVTRANSTAARAASGVSATTPSVVATPCLAKSSFA